MKAILNRAARALHRVARRLAEFGRQVWEAHRRHSRETPGYTAGVKALVLATLTAIALPARAIAAFLAALTLLTIVQTA